TLLARFIAPLPAASFMSSGESHAGELDAQLHALAGEGERHLIVTVVHPCTGSRPAVVAPFNPLLSSTFATNTKFRRSPLRYRQSKLRYSFWHKEHRSQSNKESRRPNRFFQPWRR